MSNSPPFLTTVLLLITTTFSVAAAASSGNTFRKIYAFGDSYTDTGNTVSSSGPSGFNYVSSLPYGTTFFHRPTNRYSDGRLMIDFVAEYLSLPLLPPYRDAKADRSHGVNFAVAGSTAIRHSFFVRNNLSINVTPQSLGTQLIWFEKFLEDRKGKVLEDSEIEEALFWVGEIGANDHAYTIGSSVKSSTIQKLSIKSITGFLQVLLKKGAKYVVVQGLPTTGCLPLTMYLSSDVDRDDIGCVGSINKNNYEQNKVLQTVLKKMRQQFPKAVIVYADFWGAYHEVMKNPGKYGFRELFEACCGSGGSPYNFELFGICGSNASTTCKNPNEYVNWDGVHLTEGMYKVVAGMVINGTYSRPSFEYLLKRREGGKM
ncbi:GDSL esterase/lipase At3g48460-like [Impatiens glandulifera]|uniref:GDSL esterase/lipase At3g48460-like n=1 Tax=Impatiens glandulifera TaxID=253017 RepID=UPI001FB0E8F8|nr:GDSL esterase/lipase At3g48460-like [Impatiens glandulifera]